MIKAQATEVRYFERGWSAFLSLGSGLRRIRTHRCEFEMVRYVSADGHTHILSGPPPPGWNVRLPTPEFAGNLEQVRRALQTIRRQFEGRANLCYSTVRSCRLVTGTSLSEEVRLRSVWALTGKLETRSGRNVPVGWSGTGSGLDCLEDESALESLECLRAAVDRASATPDGAGPALLTAPAAAVLLHEAVGHFAEASALSQVDLRHRVGCRVGSELLQVLDDPSAVSAKANYDIDDDGVAAAGPTELVRDGVLTGQLHSLASALAAGADPTGNGRSSSAWKESLPRMSNLICAPGKTEDRALMDNLGSGILIHRLSDGYSLGGLICAQIVLAEHVRGGKPTGMFLTGGEVRENLNLFTRTVELGSEARFHINAMCGKAGQVLFDVGTCAPAMRLSMLRVAA